MEQNTPVNQGHTPQPEGTRVPPVKAPAPAPAIKDWTKSTTPAPNTNTPPQNQPQNQQVNAKVPASTVSKAPAVETNAQTKPTPQVASQQKTNTKVMNQTGQPEVKRTEEATSSTATTAKPTTIKNWGQSTTAKTPPATQSQTSSNPQQTVNHSAYRHKTRSSNQHNGYTNNTHTTRTTTTHTNQQQGPNKMEMWLDDAAKAKAKPVALSDRIKQTVKHLANNPEDFMISAATSMATVVAVKMVFTVMLGTMVSPILIGVLAAGAIGMYRANQQVKKEGAAKIRALQAQGIQPTQADLAAAQNVSSGAILNAGIRHALFSGIIGAFLGDLIPVEEIKDDLIQQEHPTKEEFAEYKAELLEHNQPEITEEMLIERGFYEPDATPKFDDFNGNWLGESIGDQKICAIEDITGNDAVKNQFYMERLDANLASHWEFMKEHDLLSDKYVGQEINGQEMTPAHIMAGIEQYGAGDFNAEGKGTSGFAYYLTEHDVPPEFAVDNVKVDDMTKYLEHFDGNKLPFDETSTELQFAKELTPAEAVQKLAEGAENKAESFLDRLKASIGWGESADTPANDVGDGHDHSNDGSAKQETGAASDSLETKSDSSKVEILETEREEAEAQKKTLPAGSESVGERPSGEPIGSIENQNFDPIERDPNQVRQTGRIGPNGGVITYEGGGVDPNSYWATGEIPRAEINVSSAEEQALRNVFTDAKTVDNGGIKVVGSATDSLNIERMNMDSLGNQRG